MGRGRLELAQSLLRVALAWHTAGSSTPKDLRVNTNVHEQREPSKDGRFFAKSTHLACVRGKEGTEVVHLGFWSFAGSYWLLSQCSLHNVPIFRLLLKVAVNGTHQCESLNFCGASCPNFSPATASSTPRNQGCGRGPLSFVTDLGGLAGLSLLRLYLHRISAKVILRTKY